MITTRGITCCLLLAVKDVIVDMVVVWCDVCVCRTWLHSRLQYCRRRLTILCLLRSWNVSTNATPNSLRNTGTSWNAPSLWLHSRRRLPVIRLARGIVNALHCFTNASGSLLLARDAQATLALIVTQCLSIHLCVHLCVCPRQLESCVCTQHCAARATSTTGCLMTDATVKNFFLLAFFYFCLLLRIFNWDPILICFFSNQHLGCCSWPNVPNLHS